MIDFEKIRKKARSCLLPFITFLFVSWMVVFFGSCRYYNLEQKLDPVNKDWLNRVRYIITTEESHIFLDLPDEEKEAFKEEFWKRRDPDPNTEENEFQPLYIDAELLCLLFIKLHQIQRASVQQEDNQAYQYIGQYNSRL